MNKKEIARKNDLFRRTFLGGKVMFTSGVNEREDLQEIIKAVQTFDNFTQDNDPYQEHDFGKFTVNGQDYFFKIDYYDEEFLYFKEDGNRVLSIICVDEY